MKNCYPFNCNCNCIPTIFKQNSYITLLRKKGLIHSSVFLFFIMGLLLLPIGETYGQCPTGDCLTRTLNVNFDALPVCGDAVLNLSGDINAGECLDGSTPQLKCFRFIFTRTNTTSVQSFNLNFGQGQGCNGELDASYSLINGVCTKLSSGGSQTLGARHERGPIGKTHRPRRRARGPTG